MKKRSLTKQLLQPSNILKRKRTVGNVPGEVIFTGQQKLEAVEIHYMEFNHEELFEETVSGESIQDYHEPDDSLMQWYDIRGLHNTNLIQEIGTIFSIHQLILEDVADTFQRPKYEEFDNGNFITFKKMKLNEDTNELETLQISLFFGNGFLISFQEEASDIFQGVKQRIRNANGRIRKRNSDYLAYALIDTITDTYFGILDKVEFLIEKTENDIYNNPNDHIKVNVHNLKMEMLDMRKNITPLREAVGKFVRSDSELVQDETIPFIQDLYDHMIQITDLVESSRDSLTGLQELYMSEVSFRMNQIMKVLTVVTTIFIPLSFLTGLYGMNFDNMPELHYKYGYYILWAIMILIAVSLLLYFRRKKWL